MATLNVSLPASMRKFIDAQVAKGGYSTASEYVRELIRHAEKQAGREWLETELLKGLESGPGVLADDKFWKERRAKLAASLGKRDKLKRLAR